MSGEISPTGKRSGPGSTPELRASHADRDRVVDALRIAAGDGLLTADELDERLETALSARTLKELAPLTADLPPALAAAGAEAKDVVRIEQVHSGPIERAGCWVVPRKLELAVTYCKVTLDFTDAVITHDTLRIDVAMTGKTLTLVTRPGIVVDTDGLQLVHSRIKYRQSPTTSDQPVTLRVELVGQKAHGRVVVRPSRRTLGQRLLRRPASPIRPPA
ncbi:DUF1707 SHOCT-like domain-containing protein [Streptomyces lomondensis]|uniref:DUF1707 domain-containing protein n=1 Tax=Streptomyces lomondensis TaxID=68229 RepID=A0ABQ2XEQ2_9ACTN|nr:DUF1707 domain-containing protein [Streptomyces lomondensis]MCF0077665.1 DUF1707 domain-containing protein [Streptomyces lomondensis]GGX13446.1 hypothetical protein GCM10010383_49370 [Streptomyces lomondensis]